MFSFNSNILIINSLFSFSFLLLFVCCCCSSVTQSCQTICDPMDCSTPGILSFTIPQNLPKLMSIELVMPSNNLVLCCPLLLPSIFPNIRVFPNESALHIRWPGVSASASVLSMNIQDWFPLGWTTDLLAVQGTLKSLLQHHSSKASVLWCSAFFIEQLSQPYMTTRKTIDLTRRTFVGKVMSLFLICCLG